MRKHFRVSAVMVLIALFLAQFCLPARAEGAEVYDAAREGILTEYFSVEQGYITGIVPGTSVEKLLSVCAPYGAAAEGETVATGTTVHYLAGEQEISLTAVVKGDLNGDGAVTISDLLIQKSALLGQEITPLEAAAGDLNHDGSLTITDFLTVKSHLLGLETVQTVYTGGELLVLEPESTAFWQTEGAAGYTSDNASLFTIDDSGLITAAQQEGSAFVYALGEDGSILRRQMVTVLSEPLTLSLGMDSCKLIKDQSLTLTPTFNHPASNQVVWTSSDDSVVTVENGTVTAVGFGEATVSAALSNGFRTELSVTVMPPVTHVEMDRALYKVKRGCSRPLQLWADPADCGEEFIWTTDDPNIATVSNDGTVTGVSYGTVTITATGKYSGLSASCQVKVCDVIQVALTFDDGPSSQTVKLLDFMKENDIRATFFIVGNRIAPLSDIVVREAAEGHEIGYHSYDHAIQTGLTSQQIKEHFALSDQALYELTGQHFTLWRTPGGGYNNRVLSCVELPHILWSVDTLDWESLNAYSVYRSVVNARDGAIILMHDLYRSTVEGAIMAMEEMQAGDYEFLTVTELLSRNGTPPQPGKTYYSANHKPE